MNALLAHLAHAADPRRKEIMKEAERSYDLLNCMAGPAERPSMPNA